MESNLILGINIAAILVMLYCLWTAISLGRSIPGGVVGKQWRTLTVLVVLFTVGYFVTPFFGKLPPETVQMVFALIFFFGAVYVLITIRLIYRVIEELSR